MASQLNVSNNQGNGTFNLSIPLINYNEGLPPKEKATLLYQVIQTLAYSILIVMSVIGNTLVIATVVRNSNKRMRTVSNILIVNLSVADLLVSLINMPSKIAEIYIANAWLFSGTIGFVSCKIMRLLPFLAVFVSTQSFSVLALDRFFAVYFPIKKPITTKVAYLLVGLVWVLSIGFYYVYCHSATLVQGHGIAYCQIDPDVVFHGVKGFMRFVWVEFSVVIIVPLVVSLVLYAATMIKLWKRKVPRSSTFSTYYTDRVNRKVLKMLVTVFMVFLICWLPSWIWIINCVRIETMPDLPAFCFSENFAISRFIVAYSNSSITPLVYLVFSENYRQGFVDIIVAISCCPSVRNVLLRSRSNRIHPSFTGGTYNLHDRNARLFVSGRSSRIDRVE